VRVLQGGGVKLTEYGIEQQATIVEDYFIERSAAVSEGLSIAWGGGVNFRELRAP
jgi:hypothetical protein